MPAQKYFTESERILSGRYYAMQQRCENPNNPNFEGYGGRGIKNKFKSCNSYIRYILTHFPHKTYKGLDVDREDNNGHYEKGNIRVVKHKINLANTRRNVWLDYKGEKIVVSDLIRRLKKDYPECGLSPKSIDNALRKGIHWRKLVHKKGYSILTEKQKRYILRHYKKGEGAKLAKKFGVSRQAIYNAVLAKTN